MTLIPKTLLTRAFLLITALILLSIVTLAWVFRQASEAPRAQQKAQLVVSTINLTRAAILSAAPQWRGALLAELREAEGMRVEISEPTDTSTALDETTTELRLMTEAVRAKLGKETHFASTRNGINDLWVNFYIGQDEFWVAIPRTRIEQPMSRILLLGGGVALIFALLGAYLIARQVARPLQRLSQAAQQIGQGKSLTPLPEVGTHEIVTLSRAFNQMSSDLADNEKERALVLAGISHDLRTPLARMRIAAELSKDESLRNDIEADVMQMDDIIQQFLDFARLDVQERTVTTDLSALISEVAQRYATHHVRTELITLAPQDVRPTLLKRALSNLLDNAVKYGDGEITVNLRQAERFIEISVSDRGAGIPHEHLESAKRPFVRLESARSDASGSGLGLAIVERAAKAHHGELILATREGGGLVATLRLPLNSQS
ncbi:MAG: two-component sensor histidine kinase [Sideroxydans sp.]|nr:two-component sensor histidine kinase [Sideroxydans sp.]